MTFDLKITKIDVLTIVLLSTLFFSIAAYNVGAFTAPTTNWVNTTSQSFYVDLGSSQQVQTIYFFVRQGNATVDVSSGSPDHWSYLGTFVFGTDNRDYHKFYSYTANANTQFLEFNITAVTYDARPQFYWSVQNPSDQEPSPYVSVQEIGLMGQNNQQITIPSGGITGENNTDATLNNLIDEQNTLEIPPTYMSRMYFDEIYFGRAAIDFVNHQIPVERTHPSLGKLIQAVGVAAFGETPFGWRIMGVIFGTLLVPLMYLIGKKLFGTWIGGFSAAFLFTFDFMHFTMARIGTVDTYVVFFSLLTQLFFLIYFSKVRREGWKTSVLPLFLAVVFTALAFSTKWFSLFGALGMLALLFALRFKDVLKLKGGLADKYVAFFNHPFMLLLAFVGVFAAIYAAVYIPEMLMGDSPLTIWNLQNAMLSFHAGTVVDSTSSPWWSWPLMFRPDGVNVPRMFEYTGSLPNNTVSTITVFGNPAVWWLGFGAMLVLAFNALHIEALIANLWSRLSKSSKKTSVSIRGKGWDTTGIFIVVVYAFSWLPYIFIGRAAYIYHYYLSVPLLCFALTYYINKYWHKPIGKIAAIIIFAVTVAMFIYFYPVISGASTTTENLVNMQWFKSWDFT